MNAHQPDLLHGGVEPIQSRELCIIPQKREPNGESVASESDEKPFNWNDDESIVLWPQQAIAIYRNSAGGLVIRQERDWSEEEDTYIVISPENIEGFLDRLCDVADVPSFGGPKPRSQVRGGAK